MNMIIVPDNFPSYTSYNAKNLLKDVDILKACIKELQIEIHALKSAQPEVEKVEKVKKTAAKS